MKLPLLFFLEHGTWNQSELIDGIQKKLLQLLWYLPLHTLLEIYFGGDKYRNFGTFYQIASKIISTENNLRPLPLYVKYPDFQEKRRNISPVRYLS